MTTLEEAALRFVDAIVQLERETRDHPAPARSADFAFMAGVAQGVADGDVSFAAATVVLGARADHAAGRVAADPPALERDGHR